MIRGNGWGHGVGMSQCGAYGFAKQGRGYREILAHYYQGTEIGRVSGPRIRVLLAAGRSSVEIGAESRRSGSSTAPERESCPPGATGLRKAFGSRSAASRSSWTGP